MRIPFEVTTESVEDTDETGSKSLGFIHFVEHVEDSRPNSPEEAIERCSVLKKKGRSSSGMVKTQCLCLQRKSLSFIEVARLML